MRRLQSRDEATDALALKTQDVPVDADTCVRVRELTLAERKAFFEHGRAKDLDLSAWLCTRVVIDDAGQQIFGEDDAATLSDSISPTAVEAIVGVAMELSGLAAKSAAGGDEKND